MKDEFEFIKFLKKGERKSPRVLIGIGDDSAVILPFENRYLLLTSDSLCEEVHFKKEWMNFYQIAKKALLRGISDIVACGGYPLCANVNLKLSKDKVEKNIRDFYEGLIETAREYGFVISGGDLTLYNGKIIADVFVLGEVERGYLTLRSGAREGDLVCVTGKLGLSRLAIEVLDGKREIPEKIKVKVLNKFYNPKIPLKEIREVVKKTGITSMIDISDGLGKDLNHIAMESGVKIVVEEDKIPVADEIFDLNIKNPYEYALNSGEEYEMIFTIPEKNYSSIKDFENLYVSVLGRVYRGKGVVMKRVDGSEVFLKGGYDHFLTSVF